MDEHHVVTEPAVEYDSVVGSDQGVACEVVFTEDAEAEVLNLSSE